jgi:hypothetical protein
MRFRLRTLLILMVVAGLWLSTITGYESAHDVRALLVLSVVVASAVAAIRHDGPRRAFWAGFFLAVLPMALGVRSSFLDTAFALSWAKPLLDANRIYQNLPNDAVNPAYFFWMSTIRTVVRLLIATMMGILGVLVYQAIDAPPANNRP